jgi:hypothetical protein
MIDFDRSPMINVRGGVAARRAARLAARRRGIRGPGRAGPAASPRVVR